MKLGVEVIGHALRVVDEDAGGRDVLVVGDCRDPEVRRNAAWIVERGNRVLPMWDDVELYTPEWYRRFRDWHLEQFPDVDQGTRDNLDRLIEWAEQDAERRLGHEEVRS